MQQSTPAPARAAAEGRGWLRLSGVPLGQSMMPVFVGLAAALFGLALIMSQTIIAQRDARAQATIERSVLVALNELMLVMVEAESGQRGFVLTGDRNYLDPYLTARPLRDKAIGEIAAAVARSGNAQASADDVQRLRRLTDAKFIELDRTVRLAETGMRDQALTIIKADLGRIQMTAIREEIARQSAERETLRKVAMDRLETAERRLLPLIGVLGAAILVLVYAGLRAERSRAQAAAAAEQSAALREANQRNELLARELNHRVKNLFSVILSIVALSGRKQASSREIVDDIRARIRALSLAHAASQGPSGADAVRLGSVIAKTMEPYTDDAGLRVRVNGPEVELPVSMVTPLGLIIHELATNAVKYGALSVDEGTVDIRWEAAAGAGGGQELRLRWVEAGGPRIAPDAVGAGGFGAQMTTLAAGQLGGTIAREWPEMGVVLLLSFPLP